MIWIETQRGIYRVHERQEGKGNPRIGDDYFTLNNNKTEKSLCWLQTAAILTMDHQKTLRKIGKGHVVLGSY